MEEQQNPKRIKLMQRKYKGSKSFMVNGAVDREATFSVSYVEWNAANLLPGINNGEYKLLIYPCQSGKTTRIKELMQMLREEHYFPIYIDMKLVLSKLRLETENSKLSFDALFFKVFINAFNSKENQLQTSIDTETVYDLLTLFSPSKAPQYFRENCKVVLLLDEIDSIKDLDNMCIHESVDNTSARRTFFSVLRSLKPTHFKGSCLHSLIGITNATFDYSDTLSYSPSITLGIVFGSYFTKEDANQIWKQYEEQEKVIVDERIKEDIFYKTNGSQGAFMMLASYFHNMERDETKPLPCFSKWKQATCQLEFWQFIKANFIKMETVLQRNDVKRSLLQWILGKSDLNEEAKRVLQQANILKLDIGNTGGYIIEFASPLVRQFTAICMNSNNQLL